MVRHSRYIAAVIGLCTCLRPQPASADGQGSYYDGEPALLLFGAAFLLEPLIPDLRYEFGGVTSSLVLAWPLSYYVPLLSFGPMSEFVPPFDNDQRFQATEEEKIWHSPIFDAGIVPFIEPQWQRAESLWRLVLGARVPVVHLPSYVGVFAEGGYVLAKGGSGPVAGGGLSWGPPYLFTISVAGRRVFVPDDPRYDVTIDLQVPLNH